MFSLISKCQICGCTENNACVTEDGPCSWANHERNLCSACTSLLSNPKVDKILYKHKEPEIEAIWEWAQFIRRNDESLSPADTSMFDQLIKFTGNIIVETKKQNKELLNALKQMGYSVDERIYCDQHLTMHIEREADFEVPVAEGYVVNLCSECVEEWGDLISEKTSLKNSLDILPTNAMQLVKE